MLTAESLTAAERRRHTWRVLSKQAEGACLALFGATAAVSHSFPSAHSLLSRLPEVLKHWTVSPCRRYVRNTLLRTDTQRCAMTTVSALMAEHDLDCIDLLKIDVEGAELDVLRGIRPEDWPRIHQASALLAASVHAVIGTH